MDLCDPCFTWGFILGLSLGVGILVSVILFLKDKP